MSDALTKFQDLLRELFQFDTADLDFGIYRILNLKRSVIERFIHQDLPATIADRLGQGAQAEEAQAAKSLAQARQTVLDTLGPAAFDASGELTDVYQVTPVGKAYLAARDSARGARSREALEAAVYNHLYAFFSRYYQDGDFISKRRYSRRERYAIPYNGEEVYLYWANRDQYYIKTGETFTDYTFTAPNGVTVHFKLQAADVEHNNVKGDKRFFLPRLAGVAWEAEARRLTVPFEYRPLTEQEGVAYGGRNQQEAILDRARLDLPRQLSPARAADALAALEAKRATSADGQPISYLEYHLRQYTRRNTADFFIHKDLKGFLTRELDFYLKNEVLNLDELMAPAEDQAERRAEGWFETLRLVRAVGGRIIDFLHQIEEFQKRLWEKRKFITDVQYCITVGTIHPDFYPAIAACEAQWAEWRDLLGVDEGEENLFTNGQSHQGRRVAFLNAHPSLPLDTRHFDRPFVDRLLASFPDLDELTDGLLINGENWQALNLLRRKYHNTVDCIYIDPPYNTDAGPIAYKNGYRDSSWLSLMCDRVSLARTLTGAEAIMCITIDDVELHNLRMLLERLLPDHELLGAVTIKNNPAGRTGTVGFSISHEYALFYGQQGVARVGRLPHNEAQRARYKERDEISAYEWTNFRKHGGLNTYRTTRPRQFYPFYVRGESIRIPKMEWDNSARAWHVLESPIAGEIVLLPVDEAGRERIWDFVVDTAREQMAHLKVRKDSNGAPAIYRKWRLNEQGMLPQTVWDKSEYSAAEYGTNLLANIFGETHKFTFPKSVHAVSDCLRVANLRDDLAGTVLDYFAGSGTTGHAVVNLNREDGGRRRFILVEMADYFDTVLLPRLKKVAFTPEWSAGRPKRGATAEEAARGPRILKIIRLESYEDALNNIAVEAVETADEQLPLPLRDESYRLRYMLGWETRGSETLLNVEGLGRPFDYRLRVHRDGQTAEAAVDLAETFNYLLGLQVETRRVYHDEDRRYLVYRGQLNHRVVVVLWRATAGWNEAAYERDRRFVAEQGLTAGADEVFVNGDSLLPGARALEPVFKARLFAPVEG